MCSRRPSLLSSGLAPSALRGSRATRRVLPASFVNRPPYEWATIRPGFDKIFSCERQSLDQMSIDNRHRWIVMIPASNALF